MEKRFRNKMMMMIIIIKISQKTKTSLERWHCGATRSGMDKDSKGQSKFEDSGGGLLPAMEGYSLQ